MTDSSGPKRDVFELPNGEVCCWAELQSSIMLKSVTSTGDPVEMSAEEARLLAAELMRMAAEVDGE